MPPLSRGDQGGIKGESNPPYQGYQTPLIKGGSRGDQGGIKPPLSRGDQGGIKPPLSRGDQGGIKGGLRGDQGRLQFDKLTNHNGMQDVPLV